MPAPFWLVCWWCRMSLWYSNQRGCCTLLSASNQKKMRSEFFLSPLSKCTQKSAKTLLNLCGINTSCSNVSPLLKIKGLLAGRAHEKWVCGPESMVNGASRGSVTQDRCLLPGPVNWACLLSAGVQWAEVSGGGRCYESGLDRRWLFTERRACVTGIQRKKTKTLRFLSPWESLVQAVLQLLPDTTREKMEVKVIIRTYK